MSAPENIARRLAERFAPELGERLPVAVRHAIADAAGEETPFRSIDPAVLITYAGFVVNVATLAWTVHKDLRQMRQAGGEVEKLKQENAALRALLLAHLQKEAPRTPELDESVRARLLEAAAHEAHEEAARRGDGV